MLRLPRAAIAPAVFALVSLASGCSSYVAKPDAKKPVAPIAIAGPADYVSPCPVAPTDAKASFECDHKSILAMAGEFKVRFTFDETVALAPGYAPHDAQRSGGSELVLVIADTGTHVSLQHILVLGKDHTIVKHWRQDWDYEPARVLHFRGNGRFEWNDVADADRRGAWSQTVFEVDDAPRYAGVGRWKHSEGEDSWTSDRTWRPLPRREYTKRTDYQALDVVNRHTLTPAGWVHEQDNTKLRVGADGAIVSVAREVGVNSYTRITDYDFAAGRDYWKKTEKLWSDVRDTWAAYESRGASMTTSPEPNGEPRIDKVFDLAERAEKGESIPQAEIKATLDPFVH
jgi:hypothetical protein